MKSFVALALAALLAACAAVVAPATSPAHEPAAPAPLPARDPIGAIDTLVVIYAENRAFDTLYGLFPGADGIAAVNPASTGGYAPQRDRDGRPLATLPPTWGGVVAPGQGVTVAQAQTAGMPNRPFRIDDAAGFNGSGTVVTTALTTRDLVHRFYSNQMQIASGRNEGFAAWADAGGLALGHYDGASMALWRLAAEFTLADHFFMGAFGGSYLNHQYLVCACAPVYPDAEHSPAKDQISAIELDGQGRFVRLTPAADSPASALDGPPKYLRDGALTPRMPDGQFHGVNTLQPAFQPSGAAPAPGGDPRYADRGLPTTSPPLTEATIGDRLDARGVSWAWYAGGWEAVSAGTPQARSQIYGGSLKFQPHHQPFNYYAAFDPATHADRRAAHLRDFDTRFLADARAGRLPAVSFYKPQGQLNQHAGYANLADGDAHLAAVIEALRRSPQWAHMLIVVTYDENGGFHDHLPVPRGDAWGPGTRIPAILVSPFVRKGHVDKTPYDTGSILRFITRRWALEPLPGLLERDRALQANGQPPMGDLAAALVLNP